MKSTDWRWGGRGRRHGRWYIVLFRGRIVFWTAESPRWFARFFVIRASWWPRDDPRLDIRIWRGDA